MHEGKLNQGNIITDGPFIYMNWLAANKGEKILRILEYPLYTDAHITGEVIEGYGPYKFFNAISFLKSGVVNPGIFLRMDLHLSEKLPDFSKTSTEFYHGGWLPDEISALVSLALGIRLKACGSTREFYPDGDPFGRPSLDYKPYPILSIDYRRLILPNVAGTHSLEKLTPLSFILKLSPSNLIALIRAARFYQDALWIAESEPSLSWIMFVSAVETAANQWRKEKDDPIDRLKNFNGGKLYDLLFETYDHELVERVANLIYKSLGSTKKFIDFVIKFLPGPPMKRPDQWAQLNWSHSSMRKTLGKVYDYRSRALHDGEQFPAPMCMPPVRLETWESYSERPFGSISSAGGIWLAKDTPILLNTFEYITRGSLLNWWKEIGK